MARINVIGQSGTGKSYYAGKLLEQAVPEFDLAVHFDIEDEEVGLSDANHDPIYQTLSVDPELAGELNWMKVVANHKKIRVVPEGMTVDEMRELYAVLCGVVMRLCEKVVPEWSAFVSCDEAHNIITQTDFDQRVERMVTGGRKHGVECLHITQRPQLLHTTVISQADRRVYFGVSDSNDLAKINSQSGFNADILQELPSRVCIVENKSTGDFRIVVVDPSQEEHVPDHLRERFALVVDEDDRKRPHYSGDDGIADRHLPV